MSDPNTLLVEAIALLRHRRNHLVIPETRGRSARGQPASLPIRANIAKACKLPMDEHHGSPVIVADVMEWQRFRMGEFGRPPAGSWDGIGWYFTSITDIERHLIPARASFRLMRYPISLNSHYHCPQSDLAGDIMGGEATVWIRQDDGGELVVSSPPRVSPARALLEATLVFIAKQRGLTINDDAV